MSYASNIGNCPVIGDDNWREFVNEADMDPNKGRGHVPRDFDVEPVASGPYTKRLSLPLIPRDEWKERIKDREQQGAALTAMVKGGGMKPKDQKSTNFCWIFAPVMALQVIRLKQGEPHVDLSPASCGSKIKNFRNVGGWGTEAVQYLAENGCVPSRLWPDTAIDRRYDTAEANAERKKFQVDEFFDLKPRNLDEHISCLLWGVPVCVGLNYWGHEVLDLDPVILPNGEIGVRFLNSWGNWGDEGYGVRSGSKVLADDAIAPAVGTGG